VPASDRTLPPRPSLDQQKKLAKELLAAHRAGADAARERIRDKLPDKRDITLADAQFTLAREYGFADWAALKAHVLSAADARDADPHQALKRAFDARDVDGLRTLLQRHPAARALLDAPAFAFDAPAIVHFAAAGDLELVDLLLELGADPDRRSDWWAGGFHALHTARGAVADRLLEAGATPDACAAANLDRPDLLRRMLEADPSRVNERGGDGQTPLHFARSREVVDLLLAHGADPDARDVDHRSTPAQWMLERRRGAGRYDLARYLVTRGAEPDVFLAAALGLVEELRAMLDRQPSLLRARTGAGAYGERPPGSLHIYTWTIGSHLSPMQVAAQFEQDEALDLLQSYAPPSERVLALAVAGRAEEARALLHADPRLLEALGPSDRRALPDAAWAGNAAAVDLLLSLGFDPGTEGQDGGTLLHCAAWQGAADCVEVALGHEGVRALVERRDPTHGSTPLGWCCHGARHCANPSGDYARVARILLDFGARPGPNLKDAPEDVLAVIRAHPGGAARPGGPR